MSSGMLDFVRSACLIFSLVTIAAYDVHATDPEVVSEQPAGEWNLYPPIDLPHDMKMNLLLDVAFGEKWRSVDPEDRCEFFENAMNSIAFRNALRDFPDGSLLYLKIQIQMIEKCVIPKDVVIYISERIG